MVLRKTFLIQPQRLARSLGSERGHRRSQCGCRIVPTTRISALLSPSWFGTIVPFQTVCLVLWSILYIYKPQSLVFEPFSLALVGSSCALVS